jgi:hypothetical protein
MYMYNGIYVLNDTKYFGKGLFTNDVSQGLGGGKGGETSPFIC